MKAYKELCEFSGREPNFAEFLAWSQFGLVPEWYTETLLSLEADEEQS